MSSGKSKTYFSRNTRSIGSDPKKNEDTPRETDPQTEAVRQTLKGNPFAKKYAGKDFNG